MEYPSLKTLKIRRQVGEVVVGHRLRSQKMKGKSSHPLIEWAHWKIEYFNPPLPFFAVNAFVLLILFDSREWMKGKEEDSWRFTQIDAYYANNLTLSLQINPLWNAFLSFCYSVLIYEYIKKSRRETKNSNELYEIDNFVGKWDLLYAWLLSVIPLIAHSNLFSFQLLKSCLFKGVLFCFEF